MTTDVTEFAATDLDVTVGPADLRDFAKLLCEMGDNFWAQHKTDGGGFYTLTRDLAERFALASMTESESVIPLFVHVHRDTDAALADALWKLDRQQAGLADRSDPWLEVLARLEAVVRHEISRRAGGGDFDDLPQA